MAGRHDRSRRVPPEGFPALRPAPIEQSNRGFVSFVGYPRCPLFVVDCSPEACGAIFGPPEDDDEEGEAEWLDQVVEQHRARTLVQLRALFVYAYTQDLSAASLLLAYFRLTN